jgi:hypothetical protein
LSCAGTASNAASLTLFDPRIHHSKKMDCRVKPGNDRLLHRFRLFLAR